jgi:hypothetical protein
MRNTHWRRPSRLGLAAVIVFAAFATQCSSGDGAADADSTNEAMRRRRDAGALDAATHSVVLAWDASGTPGVTYDAYRSDGCTGAYARQATGISLTTWTDTAVVSGRTYCYVTTAVNTNGESQYSNSAQATIP